MKTMDREILTGLFGEVPLSMVLTDDAAKNRDFRGKIYGKKNEETGTYYALFPEGTLREGEEKKYECIALVMEADHLEEILNGGRLTEETVCFGAWKNGELQFYKNDGERTPVTITEMFSFTEKAFSRNSTLLETGSMLKKTAVLAGVGSVGGYAALQLARAGVGRFILLDGDTLEIHNIARHALGLQDLGRFKTDAVKDAILNIDPFAEVRTFRGKIEEAPDEMFDGIEKNEGIVLSAGDNRACGAAASDVAEKLGLPFVSIGCWTRGSVGEIFTWFPGSTLPNYREAFDGMIAADRDEAHRAYFGSREEESAVRTEPGLFTDLTFVTDLGLKAALDLMNAKEESYTNRVTQYLTNYTLLCNTNKEELGGRYCTVFPEPLFITTKKDGIWLKEKGEAAWLTISLK